MTHTRRLHRASRNLGIPAALLLAASAISCDRAATSAALPGGWRVLDAAQVDQTRAEQRDKAVKARDDMFRAITKLLGHVIQNVGAAGAVDICQKSAPLIAQNVAKEHGVRLGRTSWKLRNDKNAPPGWVQPLIVEKPEEPRFALGPNDQLGVLLPIKTIEVCVQCHGPTDQLSDAVREKLASAYPGDAATGFKVGDLRGWFWIEVDRP